AAQAAQRGGAMGGPGPGAEDPLGLLFVLRRWQSLLPAPHLGRRALVRVLDAEDGEGGGARARGEGGGAGAGAGAPVDARAVASCFGWESVVLLWRGAGAAGGGYCLQAAAAAAEGGGGLGGQLGSPSPSQQCGSWLALRLKLPRISFLVLGARAAAATALMRGDRHALPRIVSVPCEVAGDLTSWRGYLLAARVGASCIFRLRHYGTSKSLPLFSNEVVPLGPFKSVSRLFVRLADRGDRPTDMGTLDMMMSFARHPDMEASWPLGVLTVRLALALFVGEGQTGLYQLHGVGEVAEELRTGRALTSSHQPDLRSMLEQGQKGAPLEPPVAPLFLSGCDFVAAVRSTWPLFEVLDALSRRLWPPGPGGAEVVPDGELLQELAAQGVLAQTRLALDSALAAAAERNGSQMDR
ncbi:unnamed protein product, partial [Prorocentrum cordatum]